MHGGSTVVCMRAHKLHGLYESKGCMYSYMGCVRVHRCIGRERVHSIYGVYECAQGVWGVWGYRVCMRYVWKHKGYGVRLDCNVA